MKILGLGLFLFFILFPIDMKALGALSMSKPMVCMPLFALAVGSSELLSLPPALEVPSERLTHIVLDVSFRTELLKM